MKKVIYYLPRILAIIITAFWCAFVFLSHGFSIETLIESGVWVVLLVLTILSWKEMLIGKLGFIVLGIFYLIFVWNRATSIWIILGIAGPVLLTGILFLFSKKEFKKSTKKLVIPSTESITSKKENGRSKLDNGII